MDVTLTWFCRYAEAFVKLEEILKKENFTEINAMLVGPGLYGLMHLSKPNNKKYSWEHVELAAVLERTAKQWNIVVADKSEKVCEAVKQQAEFPVHKNHLESRLQKQYFESITETLGITGNSRAAALLEEPYLAKLPEHMRDRISVAQGDITKPEKFKDSYRKFNLVICHNVIPHIYSRSVEEGKAAKETLAGLLVPGGILSFGSYQEWQLSMDNHWKKQWSINWPLGNAIIVYKKKE